MAEYDQLQNTTQETPTTETATDALQLAQELRKEIEPLIREQIEDEYKGRLQTWKDVELAELEEKNDELVRKLVSDYIQKLEDDRKPPSDEDLQKLLNQEYVTFTIKVFDRARGADHEFTIRELPGEAEQKFYRTFRDAMLKHASELASFVQANMDVPMDKKITAFLNTFDCAFDILAEGCALVLNFDGTDKDITAAWCKRNISSIRMWNIMNAQIKVNRLRDFFSQVFQAGTEASTMTMPLSVQQLQELLPKSS